MTELDFSAILLALHEAEVEYLIVGGLAAVLNGTPVHTYDVDVVHRRTPENVGRLMPVLDLLDAIYRAQPARRLRPPASALLSTGHQNLMTRYGPLDLLGSIGEELGYEDLLAHSTEMLIRADFSARVLNLETLIQIKEQLNGEKDLAMLPYLRAALEERRKSQSV